MRIGIDLGGSNYRVGLVDDNFNIVSIIKRRLNTKDGKQIIENIVSDLKTIDLTNVSGIGFCAPGLVDSKNKTVQDASNLAIDGKLEIGKIFNEIFNLPVYLDNDANCAGLAEAILGAGKQYDSVYYITHSTGIGASYILNKKIISGEHNVLGEIGSCLLSKQPKQRLEKTSAGPAIGKLGQELLNVDDSYKVFDLAKNGNEIALSILDDIFANLAFTMANIAFIVDPGCFVLGGGISNNFDFYYPLLKKYFDYYAGDSYSKLPIIKASFDEPGIIGASLLINT